MTKPFQKSLALRAEMDQLLIDSIKADLDVCLTLVDVAETDYNLGNREHAERSCMNAEKGYLDMLRFFSQVTRMTPEVAEELQSKFKQLRERLRSVAPGRDRAHQGPVREEKEEPAGLDRDQAVAVWVLDLAS